MNQSGCWLCFFKTCEQQHHLITIEINIEPAEQDKYGILHAIIL